MWFEFKNINSKNHQTTSCLVSDAFLPKILQHQKIQFDILKNSIPLFSDMPQEPNSEEIMMAVNTDFSTGIKNLYCLDLPYEFNDNSFDPLIHDTCDAINLYLLCAAIQAAFSVP
jgi:hypothetical protein